MGGEALVRVLLSVPVLKQTRVDVVLERPTVVGAEEITEVRLYVDDSRAVVARARERLPTGR